MSDFDFEGKGYRIAHEEPATVVTASREGSDIAAGFVAGRVRAEKMVDGELLSFEGADREALAESIEAFEAAFKSVRGELQDDGSVKENENPEGFVIKAPDDDMSGSEEETAARKEASEQNLRLDETTRHLDADRGEVRANERDALKDAGVGKQDEDGVEINLEHPDDANRERLSGQDRNLNPTEVHQVDSEAAREKQEKLEAVPLVDPEAERTGDGMDPTSGVDLEEAPVLETDTDDATKSPMIADEEVPQADEGEGASPAEVEADLDGEAVDEDRPVDFEDDLSKAELQALLEERGLPTSGNKPELQERLKEANSE